jgi:hypothetical protein
MFLNTLKTFALVLLGIALIGIALVGTAAGGWFFRAPGDAVPAEAKGAERPAKSVTFRERGFDDTGEILKIVQRSGEVTLSSARLPEWQLVIEFYFDGQKQKRTIEGGYFHFHDRRVHREPIDFCIQAVDLDYLPLGDAKKGHCQVLFKTGLRGVSSTSSTEDVPKEFFDFSKLGQGGYFTASASSGKEIPLFWILTDTKYLMAAGTVADLIQFNPKAKLAIAYLRLFDPR